MLEHSRPFFPARNTARYGWIRHRLIDAVYLSAFTHYAYMLIISLLLITVPVVCFMFTDGPVACVAKFSHLKCAIYVQTVA
jgi:hypothetical protein